MKHRAALPGALAALACALMNEPGSAATVGILAFASPADCCSIAVDSKLGTVPAAGEPAAILRRSDAEAIPSLEGRSSEFDDPETLNEAANGSERAGDSLGPEAMALKDGGELGDNSPDAVSSVAGPQPSILTRVLLAFADLRATVFGGP
jgi:hypothetical protein